MQPKISIITVVKDDALGLDATLSSIAGQTYKNLDVIVIDAASQDGTLEVINKYQTIINYWVSEPDDGIGDAMNKGLRQLQGELVYFLNAADIFLDADVCEKFVNTYYQSDRDDVLYLAKIITDQGVTKGPKLLWLKQHYMLPTNHQGMIYHKEAFIGNEYNLEYRLVGDLYHYLGIKDKVEFVECDMTMAVYDTNGLSTNNSKERDREYRKAYKARGVPYIYRLIKYVHEFHEALRFLTNSKR